MRRLVKPHLYFLRLFESPWTSTNVCCPPSLCARRTPGEVRRGRGGAVASREVRGQQALPCMERPVGQDGRSVFLILS